MSEKTAKTTATEAATTEAKKPVSCAAGFYCYIGPNLPGLISHGAVFKGTLDDALTAAADAIAKKPLVRTLIVSGDDLPVAHQKAKTPGNILYVNFNKLAGKK